MTDPEESNEELPCDDCDGPMEPDHFCSWCEPNYHLCLSCQKRVDMDLQALRATLGIKGPADRPLS